VSESPVAGVESVMLDCTDRNGLVAFWGRVPGIEKRAGDLDSSG